MSYFSAILDSKRIKSGRLWAALGCCILLDAALILLLSGQFSWEKSWPPWAPFALVGFQLAAGVVYLVAIGFAGRVSPDRRLLLWIFLVGILARLIIFPSTSILEDDYYRYLWDGALVAHGINPYGVNPETARDLSEGIVAELAEKSGVVVHRINHPHLRTIYPPVAQGAFALAHLISPWSLMAWRGLLLLFDLATFFLLLALLSRLRLPPGWVIVYWWCPLVLKEIFNSAHMDAVAIPFVLGALLLMLKKKPVIAACLLALATGVKVWPVILLPVFLRPLLKKPVQAVSSVLVFAVISLLLFLPVYLGGLDAESGFVAYGKYWEMNDGPFMLFLWVAETLGLSGLRVDLAARIEVGILLILWALWINWRPISDPRQLPERCLCLVAALFLLSPTQFPWYYAWVLPLLVFLPRRSLLLLSVLLAVYYLRFYLDRIDRVGLFDNGIVWIQYIPVFAILIWEEWNKRNGTNSVLRQ